MDLNALNAVAEAMGAPGKGSLAADESTGTIKKRFDAIGVENTEENRRDYRELMFRATEGMKYVSGVILYDETLWQDAADGPPLVDLITAAGSIPGIKVDKGVTPLPGFPGETITEGLDGLGARLAAYYERGARDGMVLKPIMVFCGKKCANRAAVQEGAQRTVDVLKATVPAAVPGIAY